MLNLSWIQLTIIVYPISIFNFSNPYCKICLFTFYRLRRPLVNLWTPYLLIHLPVTLLVQNIYLLWAWRPDLVQLCSTNSVVFFELIVTTANTKFHPHKSHLTLTWSPCNTTVIEMRTFTERPISIYRAGWIFILLNQSVVETKYSDKTWKKLEIRINELHFDVPIFFLLHGIAFTVMGSCRIN